MYIVRHGSMGAAVTSMLLPPDSRDSILFIDSQFIGKFYTSFTILLVLVLLTCGFLSTPCFCSIRAPQLRSKQIINKQINK